MKRWIGRTIWKWMWLDTHYVHKSFPLYLYDTLSAPTYRDYMLILERLDALEKPRTLAQVVDKHKVKNAPKPIRPSRRKAP